MGLPIEYHGQIWPIYHTFFVFYVLLVFFA